MENIFLVRHGDYNAETGDLTDYGKKQAGTVATNIYDIIKNQTPTFYSSTAPRAQQTAEEFAGLFSSEIQFREELWTGSGRRLDTYKVIEEIEKDASEISDLIVVAHFELKYFVKLFGFMLDGTPSIKYDTNNNIEKGHAIHLNKDNPDYSIIAPR